MKNYISISEFANKIKMTNNEAYKLIKNNFNIYLKNIDNVVCIDSDFVNKFLSLDISESGTEISEDIKKELELKDKKIFELQNKLLEYTDKAFDLAQSALIIQQQQNYLSAHNQEKKTFFQRLLKK